MTWYRAGTVSVQSGSSAVSGSGTRWVSKAKVGEAFRGPDGVFYEIQNIESDTSLTLMEPYNGPSVTDAAYVLVPTQSITKLLASQVSDLIALYQAVPENVADAEAAAQAAATSASNVSTYIEAAVSSAATAGTAADTATDKADISTAKAQEAAESATTAGTKADEAAASASSASGSKTAAATSATNAASSASTATSKATAAGNSATAAAGSATTATNKASEAASSASSALASKDAAAASASTATTKASEASSSAADALASKNAAGSSATSAATSASTATSKATAAAGSATAAAGSATSAANSAAAAAASAASVSGALVTSVNTRKGDVVLTKADVGLNSVDNTSDANKPVSTATQTALNANATADRNRANHTGTQAISTVSGLQDALDNPVVLSLNSGQLGARRNILVNGSMSMSHDGPQSATPSGVYAVDCFSTYSNPTNKVYASRVSLSNANQPLPGLLDALRLSQVGSGDTSSGAYTSIFYGLEGNDVRRIVGRACVLSFYVRGSKNGTGCVTFRSGRSNRSFVKTYPIATGWNRISLVFPDGIPNSWVGDSNVADMTDGTAANLFWTFLSGSAYRTGVVDTWYSTNVLQPNGVTNYLTANNDWVEITGAQLEVGTTATPFEFMAYAETLQLLNRWVYLLDRLHIAPQSSTAWGGTDKLVQFPVRMRVPPTLTIVGVGGTMVNPEPTDITHSGCSLQLPVNYPVNNYGIYALKATAYPL